MRKDRCLEETKLSFTTQALGQAGEGGKEGGMDGELRHGEEKLPQG